MFKLGMQARLHMQQMKSSVNLMKQSGSKPAMKSMQNQFYSLARQQQTKSLFSQMPKRSFNKNIDKQLNNLVNKLPNGNVGVAVAALNSFIYLLYLLWPRHNQFSFMNNFTFSMYGFNKGYIHNLFLSHFTHTSFFSYLLDSGIIYLLCQNLGFMFGNLFVAKTVLLSILFGSAFMFIHHGT